MFQTQKHGIPKLNNVSFLDDMGIVVPTLGTRLNYLLECLESIRDAGIKNVTIVAPEEAQISKVIPRNLFNRFLADPQKGLPEAINAGIASFPTSVKAVAWLGDDDKLMVGSIKSCEYLLNAGDRVVATFGICEYISEDSNVFWTNAYGQKSVELLKFVSNKLPQPGSWFKRSAFELVNGLDSSYKWAFDQDLFHKLSDVGRVVYVPTVVAQYRWHSSSLSAGQIRESVWDSARVRINHASPSFRPLVILWEKIAYFLIILAGSSLNRRSKRL